MLFKTMRTGEKRAAPLMLTTPVAPRIFAGTKIATRNDWIPIEQLSVGDFVLTAEHGEQAVTAIEAAVLEPSSAKSMTTHWPVHVPEGILGNSSPMVVSPDIHVGLENQAAQTVIGQARVSVQAEDLIGYRGIARARLAHPLTHYAIEFVHGVSLVAEGGVFFDMPSPRGARRFTPLDARQARLLVRQMDNDHHAQLRRKRASGWI